MEPSFLWAAYARSIVPATVLACAVWLSRSHALLARRLGIAGVVLGVAGFYSALRTSERRLAAIMFIDAAADTGAPLPGTTTPRG